MSDVSRRTPGTVPDEGRFLSPEVDTYPVPHSPSELYLDLLKRLLTRTIIARPRQRQTIRARSPFKRLLIAPTQWFLNLFSLELVRLIHCTANDYLESGDAATNRAEDAETMLGTRQLDNMQACITDVIQQNIPGDLLEAGVWRGGMVMFMRAVLKAHGDPMRKVWVADSFAGLPDPNAAKDDSWWRSGDMAVELDQVRHNFERFGLLDDQVRFLQGLFSASLPHAAISRLAVLRIDADLYESTADALQYLYPLLSIGGYAIFDDYQNLPGCRRAIDEYRKRHAIEDVIHTIDCRAVYWKKTKSAPDSSNRES